MALPLFYCNQTFRASEEIPLEEATAHHVVQVLRMKEGEQLRLTDGNGLEVLTTITKPEKKKCFVRIVEVIKHLPTKTALHLAVAFTKNASRNEWLLEKVTELGVQSIIPLITTRTEREKYRADRWKSILVSAMLQSQQFYLPRLWEATALKNVLKEFGTVPQKLIAHCIDAQSRKGLPDGMRKGKDTIFLTGPEGDFTEEEVNLCLHNGFRAVSLGRNRLRTETATMAACAYFNLINDES